jgi:hypothetical protein
MAVPFFVEEIMGCGKLTTKDYTPTQVGSLFFSAADPLGSITFGFDFPNPILRHHFFRNWF